MHQPPKNVYEQYFIYLFSKYCSAPRICVMFIFSKFCKYK